MSIFREVGFEGLPSIADNEVSGSRLNTIRPDSIPIPEGMTRTARSARLNKFQNWSETAIIGVPGSTYNAHNTDQIMRSVGGHFIAFGNKPGDETLHIQGRHGQVIEMSSDGSIRATSAKGLHLSIGTDGHIVLSGDLCISATGNMKFSAGNIYMDCHDLVHTVRGSKIDTINGDYNQNIHGDNHRTVNGDESHIIGGDSREMVAGNRKEQCYGYRKVHTYGIHESSSHGDMFHETLATMHTTAIGDMKLGTRSNLVVEADIDVSIDCKADYTLTADGEIAEQGGKDHQIVVTGSIFQDCKGGHNITSSGDIEHTTQGSAYIYASSIAKVTGSSQGILAGQGSSVTCKLNTVFLAGSTEVRSSAPSTDIVGNLGVTGAIIGPQPAGSVSLPGTSPETPGSPAAPDNTVPAETDIREPKPEIPEDEIILSFTGDVKDTTGKWADFPNEEQVYHTYEGDDSEDTVPGDVLEKMKKKGMDYDAYKASMQGEDVEHDSPVKDVHIASNWINPRG